jgi:thioredoxin reductase (NADPH)
VRKTECLIIGGGPAGLTAATYLGRFRRQVLLVDSGASRAAWIPVTHNLIGFTEGISGPALLTRMRAQAARYGVKAMQGEVVQLSRPDEGHFQARIGDVLISAERIVLATGGLDVEPNIPDVRGAVADGLVRYCPVCDAFEASGKRVGLIAYGKCRTREALLLRGYTSDLTVLTLGREMELPAGEEAMLREAGVRLVRDPIIRLSKDDRTVLAWPAGETAPLAFDTLYSALGTTIRSGLATGLGAEADADGALLVGRYQETTVPGLYAAGDVVSGLSQINIAAAQAAIAATHINAELKPLRFSK